MVLKPEQKEFSKHGSNEFVPATPPNVTFPITLKAFWVQGQVVYSLPQLPILQAKRCRQVCETEKMFLFSLFHIVYLFLEHI